MTQPPPVVFLLDVDNTLLDNDRVTADLQRHLTQAFGPERQARYWAILEERRETLGYTDYLGALQRYRAENPHDPHFLQVSFYLLDYSFADLLRYDLHSLLPAGMADSINVSSDSAVGEKS